MPGKGVIIGLIPIPPVGQTRLEIDFDFVVNGLSSFKINMVVTLSDAFVQHPYKVVAIWGP